MSLDSVFDLHDDDDFIRLDNLARMLLFDSVDVVFKRFKEHMAGDAKLYRDGPPLNSKDSKQSYFALSETDDMYITRICWVTDDGKKLVIELQSFKHPGCD